MKRLLLQRILFCSGLPFFAGCFLAMSPEERKLDNEWRERSRSIHEALGERDYEEAEKLLSEGETLVRSFGKDDDRFEWHLKALQSLTSLYIFNCEYGNAERSNKKTLLLCKEMNVGPTKYGMGPCELSERARTRDIPMVKEYFAKGAYKEVCIPGKRR